EVVPVRDLVVDRTARVAMAERNAAIHAARGLIHHPTLGKGDGELAKMADAIGGRLIAGLFALDLEKASYLTHCSLSLLCSHVGARGALLFHLLDGAAVFERHHLDELGTHLDPVLQDLPGASGARVVQMVGDELM